MTTNIVFRFTMAAACCAQLLLSAKVQGQSKANQKPELTAEKIIHKMAETYAKCKSYQDTGIVKTVFIHSNGKKRIVEKPFTTAFVRPDQFRFEYKEKVDSYIKEKPCYIVWRKGSEVLTWFYIRSNLIEKKKSLSSGIAGATGVSSGSAHTIPVLLTSEVGGSKLTDLKEMKLLDDGTLDKVKCFRIQGKFSFSHDTGKIIQKPTVIWIDKNTFLVRRIDEETIFSNFKTRSTTTYYPYVNSSIPGKLLKFNPPSGIKNLKQVQSVKKSPKSKKGALRIFMDGYHSSAKQAAEEEQKLLKNPDDPDTVTKLLGYFGSKCQKDDVARQKRDKYLLWIIEHHPDAAILAYGIIYLHAKSKDTSSGVKKLWIEQVKKNPENPRVLWNAANGVGSIDKKLAEQFYLKGESLDPDNPKWAERLGTHYFWSKQPEKALSEYKKAYPKTKNKVLAISRMAKSAIDCGKIKEAEKYASEMQRMAAGYGNKNENYVKLLFNANLILGRIALKQGKTDEAGKYLLKAGKTPISLRRNPDFTLAKSLLAADQKNVVIKFLKSCSQYWDKTACEKWIEQINSGKIPDFKYNPRANKK